jgi:perosamine synthetase
MPTVVIDSELGIESKDVLDRLLASGMDARRFFWPLSKMINLEARFPLANSTLVYRHALNLPSFHEMSLVQLDEIAVAFLTALNE